MAQTITNQATLNYSYGTQTGFASSNIASAILNDPLSVDKVGLDTSYRAGEELTFIASIVNSGTAALENVTITDNLGTYSFGTEQLTPYTYETPAILYINGVYSGTVVPDPSPVNEVFSIPTIPAGANAILIYRVIVNAVAPLAAGSSITNTISVSANGINEPITASEITNVESYAALSINKSMSPQVITDGGLMTYTFTIYNSGNIAATNIELSDAFNPAPSAITVRINDTLADPSTYTYVGGVLTIPSGTADALSLAAATITQEASGIVTVVPSSLVITVTGTI